MLENKRIYILLSITILFKLYVSNGYSNDTTFVENFTSGMISNWHSCPPDKNPYTFEVIDNKLVVNADKSSNQNNTYCEIRSGNFGVLDLSMNPYFITKIKAEPAADLSFNVYCQNGDHIRFNLKADEQLSEYNFKLADFIPDSVGLEAIDFYKFTPDKGEDYTGTITIDYVKFGIIPDTNIKTSFIEDFTSGMISNWHSCSENNPYTFEVIDEKLIVDADKSSSQNNTYCEIRSSNFGILDLHHNPYFIIKINAEPAVDIEINISCQNGEHIIFNLSADEQLQEFSYLLSDYISDSNSLDAIDFYKLTPAKGNDYSGTITIDYVKFGISPADTNIKTSFTEDFTSGMISNWHSCPPENTPYTFEVINDQLVVNADKSSSQNNTYCEIRSTGFGILDLSMNPYFITKIKAEPAADLSFNVYCQNGDHIRFNLKADGQLSEYNFKLADFIQDTIGLEAIDFYKFTPDKGEDYSGTITIDYVKFGITPDTDIKTSFIEDFTWGMISNWHSCPPESNPYTFEVIDNKLVVDANKSSGQNNTYCEIRSGGFGILDLHHNPYFIIKIKAEPAVDFEFNMSCQNGDHVIFDLNADDNLLEYTFNLSDYIDDTNSLEAIDFYKFTPAKGDDYTGTITIDYVKFGIPYSTSQAPFFDTLLSIPGSIEVEYYDLGGEGIAYHDNDAENIGGDYRINEGVDIQFTYDTGGGYNVGWTYDNEWIEYTVNVKESGKYNLLIRAGSNDTGSLHIEFDNTDISGLIQIPYTGGLDNYSDIIKEDILLDSGLHVMRVFMDEANYNINRFVFNRSAVIEGIELASVCSNDPETERRWRVKNPNDFEVDIRYHIYPDGQWDTLTLPKAGEAEEKYEGSTDGEIYTFFTTTTVQDDSNTLEIEYGDNQQIIETSSGEQCISPELIINTRSLGNSYKYNVTGGGLTDSTLFLTGTIDTHDIEINNTIELIELKIIDTTISNYVNIIMTMDINYNISNVQALIDNQQYPLSRRLYAVEKNMITLYSLRKPKGNLVITNNLVNGVFFYPNQESFKINGIDTADFKNHLLDITDIDGNNIYSTSGNLEWDGAEADEGLYHFVLSVTDKNDKIAYFKGQMILRK